MNNNSIKSNFLRWILMAGLAFALWFYFKGNGNRKVLRHKQETKTTSASTSTSNTSTSSTPIETNTSTSGSSSPNSNEVTNEEVHNIAELTKTKRVVDYLKVNKRLPQYYITKREARNKGWDAAKGNLCQVLPGKAIGGDRFGNLEKKLPSRQNRMYYEADVNYNCGGRNADRLVYSNDGLIFFSKDHYKTFQAQ